MSPFLERQVAFESEGRRLYGFLVAPHAGDFSPDVLLLDGFGGGGHQPRGMYGRTARTLAAAGMVSLRFSFCAHGDSEGEFRDVTIEGEPDDAHRALEYLVAQPAVRALALWCDVADGGG